MKDGRGKLIFYTYILSIYNSRTMNNSIKLNLHNIIMCVLFMNIHIQYVLYSYKVCDRVSILWFEMWQRMSYGATRFDARG